MLCTQNIIIDKVRHTVAEDRIGIFINCFLCVYKFQKHVLWTKTLYRVQKLVTLLQGQTSAILLDCTIGVYEFKNMFRKQKTIIVDKIRHIVAEAESAFLSTVFLCFTSFPNTFFGQKNIVPCAKIRYFFVCVNVQRKTKFVKRRFSHATKTFPSCNF